MARALLIAMLVLSACAALPRGGGDVLFIGDSVLAWNRTTGQSIPQVTERVSRRDVTSRALPGARITNPSGALSALGLDIGAQFGGDWRTVVLMGGANDLRSECGCNACDATLTGLVSADGTTGEIPDLAARIRATGADLLLVGYYGPIDGGGGGFGNCGDELRDLGGRLARLAETDPGIRFVTARDVIDGSPGLYASDRVHPSPAGSARIGTLVGRALRQGPCLARACDWR